MAPHFVQYLVIFFEVSNDLASKPADCINRQGNSNVGKLSCLNAGVPRKPRYMLLLMLIPTPMIIQNST